MFKIENSTYQADLHIFTAIIKSWKACKVLGILPPCYPQLPPQMQHSIKATGVCHHTPTQVPCRPLPITQEQMMKEFCKDVCKKHQNKGR